MIGFSLIGFFGWINYFGRYKRYQFWFDSRVSLFLSISLLILYYFINQRDLIYIFVVVAAIIVVVPITRSTYTYRMTRKIWIYRIFIGNSIVQDTECSFVFLVKNNKILRHATTL